MRSLPVVLQYRLAPCHMTLIKDRRCFVMQIMVLFSKKGKIPFQVRDQSRNENASCGWLLLLPGRYQQRYSNSQVLGSAIVTNMEWIVSGGVLGGKVLLNVALPGSGSLVDFGEACYCAYNGDNVGCAISIISGMADLVTLGLASSTKEAMKKTARESVAQFAKEAMKSSSKETSKTFGKQVSKELAKGVASQATKEVWHESTKMTLKSLSQDIVLSGVSSGGGKFFVKDLGVAALKGGIRMNQDKDK